MKYGSLVLLWFLTVASFGMPRGDALPSIFASSPEVREIQPLAVTHEQAVVPVSAPFSLPSLHASHRLSDHDSLSLPLYLLGTTRLSYAVPLAECVISQATAQKAACRATTVAASPRAPPVL